MAALLLSPPVALVIVLALCIGLSTLLMRISYRRKGSSVAARKSYACGENIVQPRLQPNYSEFFPFAFFFTILHVVTLTVATVQADLKRAAVIAVVYIVGAMIALSILFRKGSEDGSVPQNNDLGKN